MDRFFEILSYVIVAMTIIAGVGTVYSVVRLVMTVRASRTKEERAKKLHDDVNDWIEANREQYIKATSFERVGLAYLKARKLPETDLPSVLKILHPLDCACGNGGQSYEEN